MLQEARIGFANAVHAYRPERGASFLSFARRCVASQLATALTAARRAKHQPLNEAARGDDATRSLENLPGGQEPVERALADELLRDLERAAASFTTLERQAFAHAPWLVQRGDRTPAGRGTQERRQRPAARPAESW